MLLRLLLLKMVFGVPSAIVNLSVMQMSDQGLFAQNQGMMCPYLQPHWASKGGSHAVVQGSAA